MIRWGAYLQKLAEDGVTHNIVEHYAITEDGERVTAEFLAREVQGQWLYCPVHVDDLTAPVPRYQQRRIANMLRLPPEKYIFEEL